MNHFTSSLRLAGVIKCSIHLIKYWKDMRQRWGVYSCFCQNNACLGYHPDRIFNQENDIEIINSDPKQLSWGNSVYNHLSSIHNPSLFLCCLYTWRKQVADIYLLALPSHNCTTAYLPLQAHFLAPLSAPPFSVARRRSSSPSGRPTTTSALQVRRASVRMPEPGPRGPMAVVKGVMGSQAACDDGQWFCKLTMW